MENSTVYRLRKRVANTVALASLLLICNAVSAAGGYVGAAYGISRVNNSDFDDNDKALKAFVGGKFNPYVGMEVAVNDYGGTSDNGISSELRGYTLAVAGYLPASQAVDVFIKVGQLWWRNKIEVLDTFDDTFSGNEYFYGLGVNFNMSSGFTLRAEMERYKFELSRSDIGDGIDGSADVDVASLGLIFNF